MRWLLVACCFFFIFGKAQNNTRTKYNFNPGWKMWVGDDPHASSVYYDDADWKSVTLPHAFNEDDAFKKPIQDLTTGIVWYRKHFILPKEAAGKKIFIEFEGIRQGGEFFVNGVPAGINENGVMAFGFDITNLLKAGEENIIAARIDNAWNYHERSSGSGFEWNDKNFYANYGGINKNVWLHMTDRLYQTLPLFSNLGTTGVYVYADQFDVANRSATINIESQVKNEYSDAKEVRLVASIEDIVTHKVVATTQSNVIAIAARANSIMSCNVRVSDLHFWSWGYGYLYNVHTQLLVNGKEVDKVTTVTGFRKTAFAHGYLSLNDRPVQVHGYAQRTTNEWPTLGSAVPAWLSDYSNRLMVEGNANIVRWMHVTPWKQDVESCDRVGLMESMPAGDAEKDLEGRRWEQRMELMRDAIIYNRNNPSIIFYECGNNGISEAHMLEMKKMRDQYDPFGGRAIGSRNMLSSTVAEYGGEMLYVNKSAAKPLWAMEFSRDEGLRKYWDDYTPPHHKDGDGPLYRNQPAKEYNRNQESHAVENVIRWNDYYNERPGTGTRVSGGGVNIIFSESNTHYRGAENYRRSGEVDALRIKKQNYYANQVMWDGWVDVEHYRAHIIGHWNYDISVIKPVYVVSSAEQVELFVNGRSLGKGKRSNHFLFTFENVHFEPGIIMAKGYDASGKLLCTDEIHTAGKPYAIRLTNINNHQLIADGADVVLIEAEVVDKNGNRCPTALDMVHFKLDGNAEWRGGMAQGPDNFILSKDLPVECGVNRVLIRSTTMPGDIKLTASAQGLQPAIMQLQSSSFPADRLSSYLQRGATPPTPSFTIKRKSLKIQKAVAASNENITQRSYDDNETTDWYNDGNIDNAWIEYMLSEPSVMNQLTVKLNNFRTRSYRLSLSVDGKTVWSGVTEKSLGYVTLSFPPVKGSSLKVQLLDTNIATDEATEVNGKKLDDGVLRNDALVKGRLSIVEAEIYGPLEQ